MIAYTPLPPNFGEGLRATYKGVVATIYEYPTHALIYTIESKHEGKGQVRRFLELLREKYPEIRSSVPLSERWEKITKLNKIKIVE